ncbi:acyl-CoA carboxylase epsilon subunit [Microbacterium sp. cf332]|uniref:acyl-CoA carboxylase epsilon subunit n=1 Tax=Microbacterium sp. cf332 TaxID=1761804 RepID=UPI00088596B8|nr:acyl-CoA carboxylase epsilon subunit [Microbacterium sp. cf332]SDQ79040.1 Acyl-CoA carboxylase epsilon subunit [Microbacterium sp. cf332]
MTGTDGDRGELGGDEQPVRIEVRRGAPTAAELAAVVAVVTESYAQEAADAVAPEPTPASAWQRSARALRAPLQRGFGWGRFTG